MNKLIVIYLFVFLSFSQPVYSYDNERTHRDLSEKAVGVSSLSAYFRSALGLPQGASSIINGKTITWWLREGSYLEDTPNCRASNHFHNPLLPWGQSYMTDQPAWLDSACFDWKPWYSNITWATGYLTPPPDGQKALFSTLSANSPITWDRARDYYYKALTLTAKNDRDIFFTWALEAVGRVMHLLEDVSVPAHVRNDFTSHLVFNGITSLNPTKWYIQPYEKYVQINPMLVANANPDPNKDFPAFTNTRLTDFWDANVYNGSNPSALNTVGLAEFTNANYFSDFTITTDGVTPEHAFPYPYISGSNTSGPSYQICVDYAHDSSDKRKYISRKDRGACPQPSTVRDADHFATASLINPEAVITDANISNLKLWLDNNVHNTYAKDLLPRAVGYSAALLNYFFRGSMAISLPVSGVYAQTTPAQGFTRLNVLAQNTTPTGEAMNDGSMELVVIYRLAYDDPFKNYPPSYDFKAATEYSYIVVPEANNKRSIPRDAPTELTFDLSGKPIPLYAIDLNIQLVYHGKLGNEDGAVVAGLKDISEPTPVDILNDMDVICLNGSFYTAGSPDAIAQVDSNHDGKPEWDIYAHDLQDMYFKTSQVNNPIYASPADYNFVIPTVNAGGFTRAIYILTNNNFNYSSYQSWLNTDPRDLWMSQSVPATISSGIAIKNQTYHVEDAATCAPLSAPCNIWTYPTFGSYRGKEIWGGGGILFYNNAFPSGSECSCYGGILRTCPKQATKSSLSVRSLSAVGSDQSDIHVDSASGNSYLRRSVQENIGASGPSGLNLPR